MKHVINFSGGVCSFWAAHRVIERFGTESVTLLFADTKMEDEDLYRFNRDAEVILGVSLTVISDGRTPWEVMEDHNAIASSRMDFCSRELKRDLLDRWCKDNCYEMTTTRYVGLDWTEGHRLERLRGHMPEWRWEAPMQWEPIWDKQRMFCELGKLGIEVPRLYKMGFPHNNCGGFCVKAGQAHFAHLLKMMPERYAFHEQKECEIRKRIGDFSVLRPRKNGVIYSLPLDKFREMVEAGKEFDKLDWGGCGCSGIR